MNRDKLGSNLLLLTTSIIWGAGFVAQEMGSDHLGPNAFNGVRYSIGAVCLAVILLAWNRGKSMNGFRSRDWVKASLSAGLFLFLGSLLQQAGIGDESTGPGKAGFITGLYVVLVPLMGLGLGHRTNLQTWAGVVLATVGLWLLSFNPGNEQWARHWEDEWRRNLVDAAMARARFSKAGPRKTANCRSTRRAD